MLTIDDIRRANLDALAREAGSKRALADKLEISESQVSQWINGSKDSRTGKPRGMRLATCHRIEAALGKPRGWLDTDHSALAGSGAPAPMPAPSLAELLEAMGLQLAQVPQEVRQELADNFRLWVMYGGREQHRAAVAECLSRHPTPTEDAGLKTGT